MRKEHDVLVADGCSEGSGSNGTVDSPILQTALGATGEFNAATVTQAVFLRRCRIAWGGHPEMRGVLDTFEASITKEDISESVSVRDLANRFVAMVKENAHIQDVTHGTRAFIDDHIGDLLDPEWAEQSLLIGRGMRGELLGKGSYGKVYKLAVDGLPEGEEAVVKVFDPRPGVRANVEDCDKARKRFLHEIAVYRELDGYPTPKFYDEGELSPDQPFVIMEYLKGADLGEYVRESRNRHERLPRKFVYGLAALLFQSLHHIHHRKDGDKRKDNIVHRDIKPDNIRLCAGGRVKLMDFGLRKKEGNDTDAQTSQGDAVGTFQYMAPEQMEGNAATEHSDDYAAGLVIHELLTGRVPHAADTVGQLITNRLNGDVDVSAYSDESDVVEHMLEILAKNPKLRPSHAADAGELFFQKSDFADIYPTYAEFLDDHRAVLPYMPPSYAVGSALAVETNGMHFAQQGGTLVPDVPSTFDFLRNAYGKEKPARTNVVQTKTHTPFLKRTSMRIAGAVALTFGVVGAGIELSRARNKGDDPARVKQADTPVVQSAVSEQMNYKKVVHATFDAKNSLDSVTLLGVDIPKKQMSALYRVNDFGMEEQCGVAIWYTENLLKDICKAHRPDLVPIGGLGFLLWNPDRTKFYSIAESTGVTIDTGQYSALYSKDLTLLERRKGDVGRIGQFEDKDDDDRIFDFLKEVRQRSNVVRADLPAEGFPSEMKVQQKDRKPPAERLVPNSQLGRELGAAQRVRDARKVLKELEERKQSKAD